MLMLLLFYSCSFSQPGNVSSPVEPLLYPPSGQVLHRRQLFKIHQKEMIRFQPKYSIIDAKKPVKLYTFCAYCKHCAHKVHKSILKAPNENVTSDVYYER